MSEPILPPDQQDHWQLDAQSSGPEGRESRSHLDPASITWRRAGDARVLLTAGYVLLLQVSHPTVGAGVSEHSNFKRDPWGRLVRTLDFTNTITYGGPDAAAAIGRRIRAMHATIKGVREDGSRYHALEPEAYAWVHATLAQGIVTGHARFGRPLDAEQRERFWREWLGVGRLLGVRERDLPPDWDGFCAYFDEMVAGRLEDNGTVHDVLESIERPTGPPIPLPEIAWRMASFPVARLFSLATVGLLPEALRIRFGLSWSHAQELELSALGGGLRALTPVLPAALRNTGPGYLRRRGAAIAA